jgi:hypothetical protein
MLVRIAIVERPMRSKALAAAVLALPALGAPAQQPSSQQQQVSPPKAQAWIDVATFSGLGMPAGLGEAGGVNPMAMLGNLLGGAAAKNSFGQTKSMSPGRWVDVTLRGTGSLQEATHGVPAGFMSPPLKLVSPQAPPQQPVPDNEPDDKVIEPQVEKPKGKLLMYWGCGAQVRAGQPRVLDFATLAPADLQRFFVTRGATGRGAHSTPGRPLWPNPADARMVPAPGSLAGEHQFVGSGIENFRFQIPAAQDLMPALEMKQQEVGGSTQLGWNPVPAARAYFAAAMGAAGREEMVIWTSSELPETGFGLFDYQGNGAIDGWLREKVLLAPATTSCAIPAGIFGGGGAMLRLIAFGSELNLAHPPRPSDPKVRWQPDWAVKVRVKSVAQGMLGMPMAGLPSGPGGRGGQEGQDASADAPPEEKRPGALQILRGILGR